MNVAKTHARWFLKPVIIRARCKPFSDKAICTNGHWNAWSIVQPFRPRTMGAKHQEIVSRHAVF